jgi:nucleotide-binding universal stress UspA family protein
MNLLICLEGSPSSASALDVAIELARSLGARLAGLAIIDEPDIVAREPTGIGGASFKRDRDAALLEDARARAREWLERFRARGRAADVAVRALELSGRPAETILDEMQRHDLLVLGRDVNFRFETQERDRYTRDRILRRAGKPIIVVPPDPVRAGSLPSERPSLRWSGPTAPPAGRPGLSSVRSSPSERPSSVMIAYDGSPAAIRALRSFAASGLARGRALHVATVHDDGAHAYETATQGCQLLGQLGFAAVPENVVSIEPTADALLTRRDKLGAGLVVVGGYVPSPLARLMWGSVTHELLGKTPVPVFLHY